MIRKKMIAVVLSVTGVVLIAKLLGFVKQLAAAALFGASLETDLINLSQGVLGDIQYVLAQVLLTAFTSLYIHLRETDENAAPRFVSDTLKAFTLITAGAARSAQYCKNGRYRCCFRRGFGLIWNTDRHIHQGHPAVKNKAPG